MTVYVLRSTHCRSSDARVYHIEKSCQHYRRSVDTSRFREMPEDQVPDDVRICQECDGRERTKKSDHSYHQKISDKDYKPADAGLTPMGER